MRCSVTTSLVKLWIRADPAGERSRIANGETHDPQCSHDRLKRTRVPTEADTTCTP